MVGQKKADRHLADVRPQVQTSVMICMKDFDSGPSWEFNYGYSKNLLEFEGYGDMCVNEMFKRYRYV